MTVDVDVDLENVAKELCDLRNLIGRYEDRTSELQSELKMANDEYFDLVNARHSGPLKSRTDLQEQLELYKEEIDEAIRVNKKQEITIVNLRKEARRYREELEAVLKSRSFGKNALQITCASNKQYTSNKEVQTSEHIQEALPISSRFSSSMKARNTQQIDQSAIFADKLLDVTFELHEQLSNCYSRRNQEHREVDHFVNGLSKAYQRGMMRLRHQQKKHLEQLSHTWQKSAEDNLNFLVKEQQKLNDRLTKAEETELQSKIMINDLKNQIDELTKQLGRICSRSSSAVVS
ncbi:hypothetical protein D915_009840 [Fasciola hepatica]|uniref:Uncharacterized protein n=1 Tax=Fasciola hepatica TaxID=6192 RepID=A0A4E0RV40_FASHE|nr:hypothetical protein D915_009840 [Fasciola hepatica]